MDKDTGLVLRTVVSPANTHDSRLFAELLPPGIKEVYPDKGFDSKKTRERLRDMGIAPRIMFKGERGHKLSNIEHHHNKRWARVRYIVEQSIAGMKRWCGLGRMVWMGQSRARLQTQLSAIAFNCKRAVNLIYT